MRFGLQSGKNVDRIDVEVGLQTLTRCRYYEPEIHAVIQYALMRWARGEEEAARRGAIDKSFHGIDLTSWTRVLAAAIESAESKYREENLDANFNSACE